MLQQVERKETEVMPKVRRRTFAAKYKREIVREADGCTAPGETGALLRRERLYSSHLTAWRRELAAGQLAALDLFRAAAARELAESVRHYGELPSGRGQGSPKPSRARTR
jgi:transposase